MILDDLAAGSIMNSALELANNAFARIAEGFVQARKTVDIGKGLRELSAEVTRTGPLAEQPPKILTPYKAALDKAVNALETRIDTNPLHGEYGERLAKIAKTVLQPGWDGEILKLGLLGEDQQEQARDYMETSILMSDAKDETARVSTILGEK